MCIYIYITHYQQSWQTALGSLQLRLAGCLADHRRSAAGDGVRGHEAGMLADLEVEVANVAAVLGLLTLNDAQVLRLGLFGTMCQKQR